MVGRISHLAYIHPRAELGEDVEIGPYCYIGPNVRIGARTKLHNNVTLLENVILGEDNEIYPGAVIGGPPQDISYRGEQTWVIIGKNNIIRECVTINRGTEKEEGVTRIGDHNFLMACCHVAHDCQLGNNIILTNGVLLGGHVHVEDYVVISGGVGIHHFARVGKYSFVGGLSAVRHDVPPFMLVEGHPARPRCVNTVALKRHNFPPETIECLAEAHRLLYRTRVGLANAREILRAKGRLIPEVQYLLDFVEYQQQGRHGRGREAIRRAA